MDVESQEELRQRVTADLDGQLPSRDEIVAARCYIAHQLGQSLGEDYVRQPLSLVDSEAKVSDGAELDGLQKQYVEAVTRNLQVRMKFAEAHEEHRKTLASREKNKKETESRILDLHMEVMRLQQKYDKQQVVIKYLERLQQQPAASPDFLDPEVMYKGCSPLPEIPKEMIDSFATDYSGADAEVDELLQKLKKFVLRSKLRATRDKQRFEQAQARDSVDLSDLKPEAKLHALNTVKNTLINWIESQLGEAGDGGGANSEDESPEQGSMGKVDIETHLADIQKEYQRHIELRKEILGLLAKKDQLNLKRPHQNEKESTAEAIPMPKAAPYAYLLTPYLEQLHSLSQEQKSLIQEKSHINSTLSKRNEYTKQTLDHLVQESQLLHKYPAAKTSKPQSSFGDATKSGGKPSVVSQVQPWIYAADSAKIGTLEIVAENLEDGMISIDESRQALEMVCKLLNVDLPGGGSDAGQKDANQDMWLPEVDDGKSKHATKKETEETKPPRNIWSILDGNLGSINE